MEDGAAAIPADPAGVPITGGTPAPGGQRGEPTGRSFYPKPANTLTNSICHIKTLFAELFATLHILISIWKIVTGAKVLHPQSQ